MMPLTLPRPAQMRNARPANRAFVHLFDGPGDRLVEVAAEPARLGAGASAGLPGRSSLDDERARPAVGTVRHLRVHRRPAPHPLGVPDVRDALRGGLHGHRAVGGHDGVVGDRREPPRAWCDAASGSRPVCAGGTDVRRAGRRRGAREIVGGMRRRTGIVVLAVALLCASCSSSQASRASTAATRARPTAPATPSPPVTAPAVVDDPVAADAPVIALPPSDFTSSISEITPELAARMEPSWRPGCPVPLEDLRYVTVTHRDFDGEKVQGSWWCTPTRRRTSSRCSTRCSTRATRSGRCGWSTTSTPATTRRWTRTTRRRSTAGPSRAARAGRSTRTAGRSTSTRWRTRT